MSREIIFDEELSSFDQFCKQVQAFRDIASGEVYCVVGSYQKLTFELLPTSYLIRFSLRDLQRIFKYIETLTDFELFSSPSRRFRGIYHNQLRLYQIELINYGQPLDENNNSLRRPSVGGRIVLTEEEIRILCSFKSALFECMHYESTR